MARQLLVIRYFILVTTFTDLSNLVNRRFPLNSSTVTAGHQPVSDNVPQQTSLSTHPVLGDPNTCPVVPVTSENVSAPTTTADVPSGSAVGSCINSKYSGLFESSNCRICRSWLPITCNPITTTYGCSC